MEKNYEKYNFMYPNKIFLIFNFLINTSRTIINICLQIKIFIIKENFVKQNNKTKEKEKCSFISTLSCRRSSLINYQPLFFFSPSLSHTLWLTERNWEIEAWHVQGLVFICLYCGGERWDSQIKKTKGMERERESTGDSLNARNSKGWRSHVEYKKL